MLVPGANIVKPVSTVLSAVAYCGDASTMRVELRYGGWMIATARLRPPRPADAPALSALMTPGVGRWMGSWPAPFTPEMAEARIASVLDAMAEDGTVCCVIEHRAEIVGRIGAARLPGTDRVSFGYWLGQSWYGRGFMREAAPAFVAALRDRPALNGIEATCHPEHQGSARVLAACGLRRVGTRTHFAPARNRDELVDVWDDWTRNAPG